MEICRMLCTLCVLCFISAWPRARCDAQVRVAPDRYRVEFVDKNHSDYTIDAPQSFLSERALQRRHRQGIAVTQADLPVSTCYLDSLRHLGFEVLNFSRWFNSAVVRCTPEMLEILHDIRFIKHAAAPARIYAPARDAMQRARPPDDKRQPRERMDAAPVFYYGGAAEQVGMMNGHALHDRGYRGRGMLIAVIDGGFYKVMELCGFDSMRHAGRLRGMRDFTLPATRPSRESNHGANVLSIIATNMPGRMMGSAPDADYVLLRTEETGSEYMVEEDNWVAAAEYADSTGADLITSSLGYTAFDDSLQNYRHCDLDGYVSRASRAATMAAARGMIVCVSAGNDGDSPWKYISVPADADSVITVGAVDRAGVRTSFSSVGNTADHRVKPDVAAMGRATAYQSSTGHVNSGSGTSYSTPLLAGLVACLWQAYPDSSNMQVINMVKRSADRYHKPDSLYGYGIPDFSQPLRDDPFMPVINGAFAVNVYSDPHTGCMRLHLSPQRHGRVYVTVKTMSGLPVYTQRGYVTGYDIYEQMLHHALPHAGMYLVEVRTDAGRSTVKIHAGGH